MGVVPAGKSMHTATMKVRRVEGVREPERE